MYMLMFRRPEGESPAEFGSRLRTVAEKVAAEPAAATVILHVQDDQTGAPPEASADDRDFDACLTIDGVAADALPEADAIYGVSRRIIKSRRRPGGGARTPGFTIMCPSNRAAFLTHEQ